MEKRRSQREMILDHLKNKGSITPIEALNYYGCFRLAAVIFDLREEGYAIDTNMVTQNGKTFASYELMEEVA